MANPASLSGEDGFGIGVAIAAHGGLAALLAWHATQEAEPIIPPERIEVSLATEISLESTAPNPNARPAASYAPVVSDLPQPPVETAVPTEAAPAPRETSAPRVSPTSRSTPRATPSPSPSSRTPPRPTPSPTPSSRGGGSRLNDNFLEGVGNTDGNDSGQPAATFGPAERSALASAITRQLRPHWSAPSGVDVDQLVTVVSWRLNRDGTLNGSPRCVSQRGINASNRPQADLHCERARRAIQLAAPFNLPEQFYSRWDDLEWDFDRRL